MGYISNNVDMSDNYYINGVKISKTEFKRVLKEKIGYLSKEIESFIDLIFELKLFIDKD